EDAIGAACGLEIPQGDTIRLHERVVPMHAECLQRIGRVLGIAEGVTGCEVLGLRNEGRVEPSEMLRPRLPLVRRIQAPIGETIMPGTLVPPWKDLCVEPKGPQRDITARARPLETPPP